MLFARNNRTMPPNATAGSFTDLAKARASNWMPLEGSTVAELLDQHTDPLLALVRSEIPAIILRGAMSASSAAAVSNILLESEGTTKASEGGTGLFVTSAIKKNRPAPQFGAYGVMLSRILGASTPTSVASLATKYMRSYEELGLMEPLRIVRAYLETLGLGRKVGPGRDLKTNGTLSPGGAFRMHYNNGSFGLHFDSLRSKSFSARSHCRAKGGGAKPFYWGTTYRGRAAERFEDLYRFEHQLAALVTLQRSEREGAEMSVLNVHKDKIEETCIPCQVTQHNVALGSVDLTTTMSERHKHEWKDTDMLKWRKQLQIEQSTRPLNLQVGDLYIFNANHLHVVHPTIGGSKRLSFGAFVGFKDDEIRIWS